MTKPETSSQSSHKWITRLIEGVILVLALVLGLTIRFAVLETAVVISRSMQPTMEVDDRVLIDHRTTLHGKWNRGDILLFSPPESWGGTDESLTKRLIGLPGETIRLEATRVLVNGRELPETYIRQKNKNFVQTIQLEDEQYFVMGDNRDNSEDSRDMGPIDEENIRGRAIYRLAPFARFGRLPKAAYPF